MRPRAPRSHTAELLAQLGEAVRCRLRRLGPGAVRTATKAALDSVEAWPRQRRKRCVAAVAQKHPDHVHKPSR